MRIRTLSRLLAAALVIGAPRVAHAQPYAYVAKAGNDIGGTHLKRGVIQ